MPIKLEVTGETPAEFTTNLGGVMALTFQRVADAAAGRQATPPTPPEVPGEQGSAEAGPTRRRRTKGDPTIPVETVAVEKLPATATTSGTPITEIEKTETPVGQADVRAKLIELMDKHGEEAPIKLLEGFSAKKISDLRTEQYAGVMAAADEALKKAK